MCGSGSGEGVSVGKNNDTSLLHYVTFIPIMASLVPRPRLKNWERGKMVASSPTNIQ